MSTTALQIEVTIDGQLYTKEQLDRYEYERMLHGLHELKHLGAKVTENGKELSHEDINWLDPEKAKQISFDIRKGLDEIGTLELFKDILKNSDQRWKDYNKVPIEEQGVWLSQTDYKITGFTIQERLSHSTTEDSGIKVSGLSVMPEHYIVKGTVSQGQEGMEVFGMFGEPTYIRGHLSAIPDYVPVKQETDYPICQVGEVYLHSDGTPIHLGAIHQFKPIENGFLIKSIFFCPKNAPKAIADGHKIHFAIEMCNDLRIAFDNAHGNS